MQLAIGSAIIEVTPVPHTGCKKFAARFAMDEVKSVSSAVGKSLRLRGLCARAVQPGLSRGNDIVKKL